jgi:3-oxoacyl-[acyl-carrier-protein] synthase-3
VRTLAQRGGFSPDDVALYVFTQVRRRSIEHVMAALGQPLERAHMIMDRWGYTGSACIPMALDDAREQGRLRRGDLVLCVGSGVGSNQAGVAFRMV